MTVDFDEEPGSTRSVHRSTLMMIAVCVAVSVACFAVAVLRISESNQVLTDQADALDRAQAVVASTAEFAPQIGRALESLKLRQAEVGRAIAAAQADDPTGGQIAARLAPVRAANDAATVATDALSTATTLMFQGFQQGAANVVAGVRYASLLVLPPFVGLSDAPPPIMIAKTKSGAGTVSDTIKKVREETFQKRDRNDFLLKAYGMVLAAIFFLGIMYGFTKNQSFAEGCKLSAVAFVSSIGTYITTATG